MLAKIKQFFKSIFSTPVLESNDKIKTIPELVPITFTIEDIAYNIFETSGGKLYINRESRNGKIYRWYIPEKYLEDFKEGKTTPINN